MIRRSMLTIAKMAVALLAYTPEILRSLRNLRARLLCAQHQRTYEQ